jgi:predicted type IV restriction endonuclease
MGMDFADKIRELALNLPKQVPHIQTEEATKNALIMPFIAALGYNVFDPTEVTPELHADVGLKRGEKVDYAILRDGKPILLFECKWHGADLNKEHASLPVLQCDRGPIQCVDQWDRLSLLHRP